MFGQSYLSISALIEAHELLTHLSRHEPRANAEFLAQQSNAIEFWHNDCNPGFSRIRDLPVEVRTPAPLGRSQPEAVAHKRQTHEESAMTVHSVPTDSILRRHFDQISRSVDLPSPPQDSILLRHYLQLLNTRLAPAVAKPAPAARCATPAVQPVMRPNHSQTPPPTKQAAPIQPPQPEPKGLFARILAKLFGH